MPSSTLLLNRIPLFKEKQCHIDLQVKKIQKNPPEFIGPFLKVDHASNDEWHGNIMLVHKQHLNPALCLTGTAPDVVIQKRTVLANEYGFLFTRWDITIRQQESNRRQEYSIQFRDASDENTVSSTKQFSFFVPGTKSPWRWAFFSCNDLSHTSGYSGYAEKYGGIVPLWTDLVHKHHKYNYNLLVGLGDQVYLDEVFEHVAQLDYWTRLADREEREAMACPRDLKEDVSRWAFFYYLRHFSQPYFDQAMSTIPSLYVMSDHDTYDGQGSYPPELENCPVMVTVRETLQKYYLLFQQHQDPKIYFCRKHGLDTTPLYGDTVTPCLKQMGQDLAILALDTRFERTREQIISANTYEYIYAKLEELPTTTVHLVVATEIPLIFPDLRFGERLLTKISDTKRKPWFNRVFRNLRTFKRMGFPFGEPLVMTDMIDHWNSVNHIEERNRFLFHLQDFAKRKSIRITFIGGDVHCCGIGRFASPSMDKDRIRAFYENEMLLPFDFAQDHRLMYQIISSAIGNVPPPAYITKLYDLIDRPERIRDAEGKVTEGRMLRFFLRDTKGRLLGRKSKKLMRKRNWCSVEMSTIDGSLFFELHVEMFLGAGKTLPYNIIIPPLDLPNDSGFANQNKLSIENLQNK